LEISGVIEFAYRSNQLEHAIIKWAIARFVMEYIESFWCEETLYRAFEFSLALISKETGHLQKKGADCLVLLVKERFRFISSDMLQVECLDEENSRRDRATGPNARIL
jgi:hypothetical protein